MGDFELMFEVCPPEGDTLDALYANEDALLSTHGTTTLVTMTSEGASALAAAKAAVGRLERLGFVVRRLYEDYVTRSEIARRAGVTPQAVGLWARSERRNSNAPPFPEPCNFAGNSELWLWHDINGWLSHLAKGDGLKHPTWVDYVLTNEWLLSRATEIHAQHLADFPVRTKFSQAVSPSQTSEMPSRTFAFGLVLT
ncbi:hypothetical protein [Kineosporia sp. A_224]|uniref:hypothetical protein n=1 Tax=Kineosporia sp. A_224 TaxID=1962180 RepID=UPI001179DDD7|nr:hypothetical protein [Kineosporia sp. A_224]